MHKMLFDTGVRPYNHCYLSGPDKGKLITSEHEEWHGGTLRIAYYLESKPPESWRLIHLCDTVQPGELSMPIVAGGMMSKYAVFYDDNKFVRRP